MEQIRENNSSTENLKESIKPRNSLDKPVSGFTFLFNPPGTAEKEQNVNKHGKVQNYKFLKQSQYNELLRKHKAIPEVGTT
jgi:hypothetical protein